MRLFERRGGRGAAAALVGAVLSVGALMAPSSARAVTLYDGSLNNAPGAQGWSFFAGGATESVGGGFTTLDTTVDNAIQSGYSRVAPFALDRSGGGYAIRFDVQVLSEVHANNDRAGFSIIALSSDRLGIELGFWTNEIWAQSGPTFTHAEGVAFPTGAAGAGQAGLIRFDLLVSGGAYRLFANGGTAPILTGALRDYTPFVGPIDPYETPNFLFLGDDTTSARGNFRLSRVEAAAIPEPGTLVLLMAGSGFLLSVRRKRGA